MVSSRYRSRSWHDGAVFSSVRPLSEVQRTFIWLALIGFLLDVGSTWLVLSSTGAHEVNPVMRRMIATFGLAPGITVTKLIAVALGLVALALLPAGWRNRAVTLAAGALAIVGIGMGAWNVLVLLVL